MTCLRKRNSVKKRKPFLAVPFTSQLCSKADCMHKLSGSPWDQESILFSTVLGYENGDTEPQWHTLALTPTTTQHTCLL